MKRVSPCQRTETPTRHRARNSLPRPSTAAARPDPPLKPQNAHLPTADGNSQLKTHDSPPEAPGINSQTHKLANSQTGEAGNFFPVRSPWLGNRIAYQLREYEYPIFADRTTGVVVLHWSRQIGKTFTLAAWAVDRLLTRPGRLVTVLSSSRENGSEFVARCAQICEWLGLQQLQADPPQHFDQARADEQRKRILGLIPRVAPAPSPGGVATYTCCDQSPTLDYKHMRMEVRITINGHTGRIKVLAANPRTARGFSGDLILDEFAFHEDSLAIWEAVEPILSSNADFLCRIASTGNGRHNLFYRMVADCRPAALTRCPGDTDDCRPAALSRRSDDCVHVPAGATNPPALSSNTPGVPDVSRRTSPADCPNAASPPAPYEISEAGYCVSRISRTRAWSMGVGIFDPITRARISPETARAKALDKRAYDQNYELAFNDETTTLLTYELIEAAEREDVGLICEQDWSPGALALCAQATGPLFVGLDVGRQRDLSVLTVIEQLNDTFLVRGILRMQGMRLPDQQTRLGEICRFPKFKRAALDMTGLGLGLFEYAQSAFGSARIQGVNFATSVAPTPALRQSGETSERVRVTEALAMELLRAYEEHRIQHPADTTLREDLRRPEKLTTPGGRVSIAATRTEAGHADHFWSFALALEAGATAPPPLILFKPRWNTRLGQAYLRRHDPYAV